MTDDRFVTEPGPDYVIVRCLQCLEELPFTPHAQAELMEQERAAHRKGCPLEDS
jgi:hypothetical protein